MKISSLAILVTLSCNVCAEGFSLKPGLWEMKLVHQVMDGRDMSARIAAAQAEVQQAMASMPPEQRRQMEAMAGRQGAGGGYRICVSGEMAARGMPLMDSGGRCEQSKVNRTGNRTTFEFNCTSRGRSEVGKGETTVNGNLADTRVDMTLTDARGSHTMQNEMQFKFLGTDCKGIKPVDQLAHNPQGSDR